jgi:UDP-glucose 4-epimerase
LSGERVLVTGGAGFIGSNLVDALLDRGDHVTVLDDLSTGRIENLAGAIGRGATLHTADILDGAAADRAFAAARPAVVYHLAAQVDVGRAVENPARDARINVSGTAAMLERASVTGVERFVLASAGGAIYGDAAVVPTPETEPAKPISAYALSKAAAELYVEYYALRHGLSAFVLRLANVYGPRGEGVIARFCAAAADRRDVTIYGDGLQTRDFVYVGDAVEAFIAAGEHRGGGVCNIGTGRETSVLDLAEALALQTRFEPARLGEVRRSCLSPARAAELLGWRPRTSLHTGLAATFTSTGSDTPQARGAYASP